MEWILPTFLGLDAPRESIEEALEEDSSRFLGCLPWKEYPQKVKTSWSLLHGPDAFFLGFEVSEPTIRAVWSGNEARVCEDSCVEWFFDWGQGLYINVEISPIGTCVLERGSDRFDRENILLKENPGFRTWGNQGVRPFEERSFEGVWKAFAVIPYDMIPLTRAELLSKGLRGNFTKCGDKLSRPHYNTWAPISSPGPDFHRPESFLELGFNRGEKTTPISSVNLQEQA